MIEPFQIFDLHFEPMIPHLWLAGLAVVALFVLLIAGRYKGRGLLFRFLLVVGLLTLLANPSLISETREYLKDTALVIIDETDSQNTGSRSAQTAKAARETLQKLSTYQNLDIQTVTVKNQPGNNHKKNDGTRLFDARTAALKSIPQNQVAATIMITDGQIHDASAVDITELSNTGPIHVLLTGDADEIDRVLIVENPPSFGIVNKPVKFSVEVIDRGQENKRDTVVLTLKLDGKVVTRMAVRTGRKAELEITIPHGGPNFIEIQTSPLEGELSENNNTAFLTVNGVRDRLKVLLVSGEPHMGERGWRNILKSDPSVDLVHFTILRPPEKQDATPINELSLIPFPIAELFERKLNEFDLIIFDRYRRRGVLAPAYLQNIVNYVEGGGALLEAAGPSFATPLSLYRTPLSAILPGRPTGSVYEEGFVPGLSDHGKRHPVTARLSTPSDQQKWGKWFRLIDTDLDAGTVLMTGPEDSPLLILERQEEGRVAQLMSDHSWLWGKGFDGGGPQAELLRRVSHWLMREPELEEERLIGEITGDQLKVTRHSLEDRDEPVFINDPQGVKTRLHLFPSEKGMEIGTAPLSGTGLYTLQSGDLSTMVAVGPLNPMEAKDIRSTADHVAPITKATGGGIHRISSGPLPDFKRTNPTGKQASKFWMGLRSNKDYEITGYAKTSLTPPTLALLLLIGALCLAWWREGQ